MGDLQIVIEMLNRKISDINEEKEKNEMVSSKADEIVNLNI